MNKLLIILLTVLGMASIVSANLNDNLISVFGLNDSTGGNLYGDFTFEASSGGEIKSGNFCAKEPCIYYNNPLDYLKDTQWKDIMNLGAWSIWILRNNSGDDNNIFTDFATIGNVAFRSKSDGGIQIGNGHSTDTGINSNKLYHLCFTYNITTGGYNYFRNGTYIETINNGSLRIGLDTLGRSNSAEGFVGYLDELYIWNRSLTTNECQELWNQGNGKSTHLIKNGKNCIP